MAVKFNSACPPLTPKKGDLVVNRITGEVALVLHSMVNGYFKVVVFGAIERGDLSNIVVDWARGAFDMWHGEVVIKN